MTRESVIELMTTTSFQVFMIGFMPGFLGRIACRARDAAAFVAAQGGAGTLAGRGGADVRGLSVGKSRWLAAARADTDSDVFSPRRSLAIVAGRRGSRDLAGDRPGAFDAMEAAAQRGEVARETLLVKEARA